MNTTASVSSAEHESDDYCEIAALFVDDEPALLEVAKAFVESEGNVHVDVAMSAEAALDVLSTQRYDAIVADYQMPGMNGIEFLKALRGKSDNTPFILFTGRGREEVVIEALNNGADFYLQKGGDPKSQFAELTNMIRQLVTKRRSEIALRESEERYRSFVQNFKGIAFRGNLDFVPLFFHGAVESITGHTEDDFTSGRLRWSQVVHPDDLPKILADNINFRETPGLSTDREYRVVRKDGGIRWVREVVSNVADASGTVQAVEGVIHDTTDRKMAEEAIAHNMAHFKALIEDASDIIAVIDASGMIRYASPSVTRILGYETSEVMDTPVLDLMHPDDVTFLEKMMSKAFKKEHVQPVTDCRIRAKDGSWIFLEVSGRLSDDFDQGPRIILNARDATERRKIQDALVSSERQFREFVERTCDGIAIIQDLMFKYVSSRLAEIGGYAVEDILGRPFTDYIWPDELPKVAQRYRKRVAGEPVPSVYETVLIRKDGTRLHVEFNAALIEYEGKPADFVIVHDITERKQAEEALRESEKRYRLLVDSAAEAIVVAQDGMLRLVNPMAVAMTGFSEQELMSKPFPSFVHPDDCAMVVENHQRRLRGEAVPDRYAFRVLAKDGSIKWMEVGAAIIDWEGRPATMDFLIDITERKRAEKALRQSEEKFRVISENSPDHIIIQDRDLRYLWVLNPQLGLTLSDIIGKTDHDFLTKEDADKITSVKIEVMKSGKETRFSTSLPSLDGSMEYFDGVYLPKYDSKGCNDGIIGYFRNVTETMRAQAALHEANRKLNLLSSITLHDINNQLMVLTGYLVLLEKKQTDALSDQQLRNAEAAAERISAIIRFAKEYEALGAKAPVWNSLGNCLSKASTGLDLRGISLTVDLDGIEILADPMLDRVFHNLIDNACKHGGEVKIVKIRHERSGDNLKLICEDDGVGIAEKNKEELFSPGHVLQMVREILAMTDMTIAEKGEHGKGARFEICVPAGNFRFID